MTRTKSTKINTKNVRLGEETKIRNGASRKYILSISKIKEAPSVNWTDSRSRTRLEKKTK